MEDVRAWLAAVGLERFSNTFEEAGYDSLVLLRKIASSEVAICELIQDIGMKKGHAVAFRLHLTDLLSGPLGEVSCVQQTESAGCFGNHGLLDEEGSSKHPGGPQETTLPCEESREPEGEDEPEEDEGEVEGECQEEDGIYEEEEAEEETITEDPEVDIDCDSVSSGHSRVTDSGDLEVEGRLSPESEHLSGTLAVINFANVGHAFSQGTSSSFSWEGPRRAAVFFLQHGYDVIGPVTDRLSNRFPVPDDLKELVHILPSRDDCPDIDDVWTISHAAACHTLFVDNDNYREHQSSLPSEEARSWLLRWGPQFHIPYTFSPDRRFQVLKPLPIPKVELEVKVIGSGFDLHAEPLRVKIALLAKLTHLRAAVRQAALDSSGIAQLPSPLLFGGHGYSFKRNGDRTLRGLRFHTGEVIYAIFANATGGCHGSEARDNYKANGLQPSVNQTDEGISAFCCFLWMLCEEMSADKEVRQAVLTVLALMSRFPPLVASLTKLSARGSPVLEPEERCAVSEGLFQLFKGLLHDARMHVSDAKVFEHVGGTAGCCSLVRFLCVEAAKLQPNCGVCQRLQGGDKQQCKVCLVGGDNATRTITMPLVLRGGWCRQHCGHSSGANCTGAVQLQLDELLQLSADDALFGQLPVHYVDPEQLKQIETLEEGCPVCYDTIKKPVRMPCKKHYVCTNCIRACSGDLSFCPACLVPIIKLKSMTRLSTVNLSEEDRFYNALFERVGFGTEELVKVHSSVLQNPAPALSRRAKTYLLNKDVQLPEGWCKRVVRSLDMVNTLDLKDRSGMSLTWECTSARVVLHDCDSFQSSGGVPGSKRHRFFDPLSGEYLMETDLDDYAVQVAEAHSQRAERDLLACEDQHPKLKQQHSPPPSAANPANASRQPAARRNRVRPFLELPTPQIYERLADDPKALLDVMRSWLLEDEQKLRSVGNVNLEAGGGKLAEWRLEAKLSSPYVEVRSLLASADRVGEATWQKLGGRPKRILKRLQVREQEFQEAWKAVPAKGEKCRIHGLKSEAGILLNGTVGVVEGVDLKTGRVIVRLPIDAENCKQIKPDNVCRVELADVANDENEDSALAFEEIEPDGMNESALQEVEAVHRDEAPKLGSDEVAASLTVHPHSAAVTEVTLLLLDVSASMGQADKCFLGVHSFDQEHDKFSVFVSSVPRGAFEEDLQIAFGGSAEVMSVSMPLHVETGQSKGFAFVKFHDEAAAAQALKKTIWSNGHKLVVKPCYASSRQSNGCYFCGREGHVSSRCSMRVSRLDVAKQMFQKFAERSMDFNMKHALGLLVFGTEIEAICGVTPLLEVFRRRTIGNVDRLQPAGRTRLFDSMLKACGFLEEFACNSQSTSLKKRLLVLTDGDDVGSVASAQTVAAKLISSDVVVDCVVLGRDECRPLKAIAAQTGGLKLRPNSFRDALALFEREAVLSVAARASVVACARQPLKKLESSLFDDIEDVPLAHTAAHCNADTSPKLTAARPAERFRRMNKEIHEMMFRSGLQFALLSREAALPLPWMEVLLGSDGQQWIVLMKGPSETAYADCYFDLVANFPSSYPFEPPAVRFRTVPLHVNISKDGRICDLILSSRNFSVNTSMVEVLFRIYQLLHSPNYHEPLNTEVEQLRRDVQHEAGRFEDEVRAHSQKAAFRSAEQFYKSSGFQPPSQEEKKLRCPLSHQLYFDPVATPAGHVYERQALLWSIDSGSVENLLGERFAEADVRDCAAVKEKVDAWKKKRTIQ
eukprot:TRINITY_DN60786_c0_g1_i1.p1 TRINITY_DN60786_c0_g1~~TRINITY_DN60786_c0_g1_i1.p1  ORF type:complete len:1747 (-),score=329.00 TRINITY_DN60786_c0_g1_i1:162-5363(-)